MGVKTIRSVTGQSPAIVAASLIYRAEFAGTGSAQLQVNINGDWLPAAASVSVSIPAAAIAGAEDPLVWRWNVTVASGSITTYLG